MKKNFVVFIAQLAIVGALIAVGTVAILGEPNDDAKFVVTLIGQLIVTAATWSIAGVLCNKWQLFRKMAFTGLFQ